MTRSRSGSKLRAAIEIAAALALFLLSPALVARFAPWSGLWQAAANYLLPALVLLIYVKLLERRPLRAIGLVRCAAGRLLGCLLCAAQLLPFVLTGADPRGFAAAPDWPRALRMAPYILLCVGVCEELLLRGFLLHKSEELLGSRALAVTLNCVLFYVYHWPPLPFAFGRFISLTLNALILCVYYYRSRSRSILPLMLAHGLCDLLVAYLVPAAMYYLPL